MTDWLFAKRTRILWLCFWIQALASAALVSLGRFPITTLLLPIILWLIYAIRTGRL